MAVTLNPAYDWPVIDSWAFGWTVDRLLETGKFIFVDWGAMSLFAHVWWGALFSLPAGFSFAAVNLSTFVLSFITIAASYLALRELSFSRQASLMGAGVLLVNPAFLLLSYSYMTDVPFLAWFTLAVWCYLRGLRLKDWRWLALGSLFATLSVLIRQNGIVLPAALGTYLGWQWLRRQRGFPWREGIAGAALPLVALITLTALSYVGIMPDRSNALIWINDALSLPALGADLFRILLYLGLFALPLTVPMSLGLLWRGGQVCRGEAFGRQSRTPQSPSPNASPLLGAFREAITPAVIFILAGIGAVVQFYHPFKLPYLGTWRMMPYYPTAWTIFGTGSQEEWLTGMREMVFSYHFCAIITALSCIGVALLLWPAVRWAWQAWHDEKRTAVEGTWPAGFLILLIVAYLSPVLLFKGEIYERYLIGLLLPVGALLLRAAGRWKVKLSWPAFGTVAAVFLAFSLALTGEFVAWNGAAWGAAGRLADLGIAVDEIDGGFPWNGWHFAGQIGKTEQIPEPGAPAYMEVTPQITRIYVVSFSPLEGYAVIDAQSYWSPLHWAERELVVLRRKTR